jgi:transaldolase
MKLSDLKVKIYADGADPLLISKFATEPHIAGFTTNPSLMKSAGIKDYETFARDTLKKVPSKPISFEVFSDELEEMLRQGLKIAEWGENVYVKVPVTNSRGESTVSVISTLAKKGVKLNVTALFTVEQLQTVHKALNPQVSSILSVFAGRIADTGRDAEAVMRQCRKYLGHSGKAELLWASSREVYNLIQADQTGSDIITMSPDLLKKITLLGKDLLEMSLDTVKTFKKDAESAGFEL